jgi:GT2 family glycosyltransferase/glycosyltransferase involved in cell wall biosynthesis
VAGSDEHRVAPGIRGWLESPREGDRAVDAITVSGWAFGEDAPLVEIRAAGFGGILTLASGLRRDDVALAYDGKPEARASGFAGYVALETGASVPLEVWATTADGRTVRLFTRTVVRQSRARRLVRRWLGSPHPLRGDAVAAGGARTARACAREARADLRRLLSGPERLVFDEPASPDVSAIVVVWNRADLTLACLNALRAQREVACELIVVDNASTDQVPALLDRIDGATVIRHPANLGFTLGANAGARAARGEFVLFLNSDARLHDGALAHLVASARRTGAAAVGGKLVFPDGRLQEAGSIIWSDGSCEAYGRGADPDAPAFDFQRPVDFCSGALLLTRRRVFEALGGFDERYRPAYYEDADYCARLWSAGHAVVYEPRASATHLEFGSAPSRERAVEMQRAHRPIFVSRHADWLAAQPPRDTTLAAARAHPYTRPAAIVIDDAAPDPRRGAGFPRAAALVRTLGEFGYAVTICATSGQRRNEAVREQLPAVEVVTGGLSRLAPLLAERLTPAATPPLVVVSRPHNMRYVKAALGEQLPRLAARWIYDAEAIYAHRELERLTLAGTPAAGEDAARLVDEEVRLARGSDAVLAVSELERAAFVRAGMGDVFVVGHAVDPAPTPAPPEQRPSILFVGAFEGDSPNLDAARFLSGPIRAALAATRAAAAPIVIAGSALPEELRSLHDDGVSWHADVDDLAPFYEAARVFVVPTRYAAGIPLKIVEAAARGVPVVGTPLLAGQLGWRNGEELLTATTASEFAAAIDRVFADDDLWGALRRAALDRVGREHSPATFRAALLRAIGTARPAAPAGDRHRSRPARSEAGAADSRRHARDLPER